MKSSFEKEVISDLPGILARLLEVPEHRIKILEGEKAPGPDFVVDAGKYSFLLESKSSSARALLHPAVVQLKEIRKNSGQDVIPLLAVPFMGESGRQFCDENGIAWLDLSGNAHIKAPGLLIHIQGRPNRFKKAGRPANLFAPKSSRIARQFLIEPYRSFTQRELSQATGLDEGYTSRIIRRLEQSRLIVREDQGSLRPHDPDQLLDAWHEAYDFSRHHIIKGHIAARSGDELLQRIAGDLHQKGMDHAFTGLAGAWAYTHFAIFRIATFYLKESPGEKILDSLHLRKDDAGANTWLVVPNDEGVFQGSADREGILCVHPVQVYLDLKGHPERSKEAASRLRQEYLNWRQDA
ncbi:MAG: hypothetical protein DRH50_17210 [Deltaproteobacteria bacterium]|nr:MAG: hypothetical protein DRH50_17210 [Deltaproteobacteria bacterium]